MTRPLHLSLEAVSETVKRGRSRHSRSRSAARGTAVDVPHIVSDPGPPIEQDFLELKAGEEVTFALNRYAAKFFVNPRPGLCRL